MARMYPNHVHPETQSAAERRLYEALRDALDHSYIVFHHVAWLTPDKRHHPKDGEADFVIAHPEQGILVLEVKGGRIQHDSRTGEWTSTDAAGRVDGIRDPFEQAKDSKYVLLAQLKVKFSHYINIGHAIAFPDIVLGDRLVGLNVRREIVLDMTNVARIADWVEQALRFWREPYALSESTPGKECLQFLCTVLGKQWDLRPALWGKFALEQQQLLRLTEEQYQLLDLLNRRRRVAVSGFAGSGKTLIATEKATRLASQGFSTLLTCYNRNLANELYRRLGSWPNLEIRTFHELCLHLAGKADLPIPAGGTDLYEQILPNLLLRAIDLLDQRYDAIVVDEGQDFREAWWIPLQLLLRDPDQGIFYIFFDDNQKIYAHQGALPISDPPYPLMVNCRTTQSIHRQVCQFYHGDMLPIAKGPEGEAIQLVFYEKERLQETLMALLQRLTGEEHIPLQEMVVLTPFSDRKSRIRSARPSDGVGLDWRPSSNQVRLATIHSVKGLERSVVVLAEIERWLTQGVKGVEIEKLLYVACSRARNYLLVLLPKSASAGVRQFFAENARASQGEV